MKNINLKLNTATHLKQMDRAKAGKVSVNNKNNKFTLTHMTGYRKSILERQSLSETEMGSASPICETVPSFLDTVFGKVFLSVKL